MAQKTVTYITDDIDGKENAETHTFAIDGKTYTIDLTADNYTKLLNALKPYSSKATAIRSTAHVYPPSSSRGTKKGTGDHASARAWAKDNGIAVTDRGRVSPEVMRQYVASRDRSQGRQA